MTSSHFKHYQGRRMFPGLFFGLFFIIGGAALIFNGIFGFNVPVGKMLLALLFFYFGLSILFGKRWHCHHYGWRHHDHFCSGTNCYSIHKESTRIHVTDEQIQGATPNLSFETRKGKATIDLTAVSMARLSQCTTPLVIHSSTRAGETVFLLNRNIPLEIHAASSWGSTQFPDGIEQSFGSRTFQSNPGTAPLIVLYSNVRAGAVKCIYE